MASLVFLGGKAKGELCFLSVFIVSPHHFCSISGHNRLNVRNNSFLSQFRLRKRLTQSLWLPWTKSLAKFKCFCPCEGCTYHSILSIRILEMGYSIPRIGTKHDFLSIREEVRTMFCMSIKEMKRTFHLPFTPNLSGACLSSAVRAWRSGCLFSLKDWHAAWISSCLSSSYTKSKNDIYALGVLHVGEGSPFLHWIQCQSANSNAVKDIIPIHLCTPSEPCCNENLKEARLSQIAIIVVTCQSIGLIWYWGIIL